MKYSDRGDYEWAIVAMNPFALKFVSYWRILSEPERVSLPQRAYLEAAVKAALKDGKVQLPKVPVLSIDETLLVPAIADAGMIKCDDSDGPFELLISRDCAHLLLSKHGYSSEFSMFVEKVKSYKPPRFTGFFPQ